MSKIISIAADAVRQIVDIVEKQIENDSLEQPAGISHDTKRDIGETVIGACCKYVEHVIGAAIIPNPKQSNADRNFLVLACERLNAPTHSVDWKQSEKGKKP